MPAGESRAIWRIFTGSKNKSRAAWWTRNGWNRSKNRTISFGRSKLSRLSAYPHLKSKTKPRSPNWENWERGCLLSHFAIPALFGFLQGPSGKETFGLVSAILLFCNSRRAKPAIVSRATDCKNALQNPANHSRWTLQVLRQPH